MLAVSFEKLTTNAKILVFLMTALSLAAMLFEKGVATAFSYRGYIAGSK